MLRDRLSEEARLAAGGAEGPAGGGGGGGEGPSRQHLMGLAAIGKERVEEIVVTYRTLQDPLALTSSSTSSLGQPAAAAFPLSSYSRLMPSLTREQTAVVCRWLVANSALGRARGTVLKWLVDAGDKQVRDWCSRRGYGSIEYQCIFRGSSSPTGVLLPPQSPHVFPSSHES